MQVKAQRQLEEAFETRLQRIQTNMQPVSQPSSYTAPSTDTNLSSSESFMIPLLYFFGLSTLIKVKSQLKDEHTNDQKPFFCARS